jgi:anthranilate synthase/aminodeoxychorismate synthase-like glutamine amidotransferase
MILVIDNYDSFTYNLVHTLGCIDQGMDIRVFRNDKIDVVGISRLQPTHLIISPGPGTPSDAGISVSCVEYFHGKLPLLGVCLGHQSIGQAMGGKIVRARRLVHGKPDQIYHSGCNIFSGLPNPMTATRYHSLVIERGTLPDDFDVTAWTDSELSDGEIMAIAHQTEPTFGVQFHPESFLTVHGRALLENFIRL